MVSRLSLSLVVPLLLIAAFTQIAIAQVSSSGGRCTAGTTRACSNRCGKQACLAGGVWTPCLPRCCSNGRIEPPEQCDDRNRISGDGCSSTCRNESRCGDRIVDAGRGETCDSSPGCRSSTSTPSSARCTRCGDGAVQTVAGEVCDDGNTTNTAGIAIYNNPTTFENGNGIAVGPSGNIYTDGSLVTRPESTFLHTLWVDKFDLLGTAFTAFPLASSTDVSRMYLDIALDTDENIYTSSGRLLVSPSPMGVAKYSSTGVRIWDDMVLSGASSYVHGVAVGSDRSVYVTGRKTGSGPTGAVDIWIRKYTPDGTSDDGPPDVTGP